MPSQVAIVADGPDTEFAGLLVSVLVAHGLGPRISPSPSPDGVNIFLLSDHTVDDRWGGAATADGPGALVVLVDPFTRPRLPPPHVPQEDLRGWDHDPGHPAIRKLVEAIHTLQSLMTEPPDSQAPSSAPSSATQSSGPREKVDWLPDDPAVVDALQRKPIARFLAGQFEHLASDPQARRSFLVHVDGPWGSGKSTLLRFLADEIKPKGWLIVPFDAWRQSKAGPAWLLLLQALRTAMLDAPPRRLGLRWRERMRLLRSAASGVATATFLVIAAGAALVLLILHWKLSLKSADDLLKITGGALALATVVWGAVKSFSRAVAFDSRHGGRAFELSHTDPMEALAEHFTWMLSKADRTVVFLIDDLDRCEQSYVVDVLDTVQKLVRDVPSRSDQSGDRKSVFFVVAADGRWLRSAYEAAHPGFVASVGDAGRPLGALFLEKLFQLTVSVPVLGPAHQRAFLASLLQSSVSTGAEAPDPQLADRLREVHGSDVVDVLRSVGPLERIKAAGVAIGQLLTEESAQQTEHALMPFWRLLDPNPRSMKRFVMAYSIARAVSVAEGNVVELEPLALWSILKLRWPLLAEHLQAEPEDVAYFRSAKDDLPPWIPGSLVSLFTEPPNDLRAVMNHPNGGPLKAAVIHRCCGTTPESEPTEPAR